MMLPVVGTGNSTKYLPVENIYMNAVAFYGNMGRCVNCRSLMVYTKDVVMKHIEICDTDVYNTMIEREKQESANLRNFSVSFNGI